MHGYKKLIVMLSVALPLILPVISCPPMTGLNGLVPTRNGF